MSGCLSVGEERDPSRNMAKASIGAKFMINANRRERSAVAHKGALHVELVAPAKAAFGVPELGESAIATGEAYTASHHECLRTRRGP